MFSKNHGKPAILNAVAPEHRTGLSEDDKNLCPNTLSHEPPINYYSWTLVKLYLFPNCSIGVCELPNHCPGAIYRRIKLRNYALFKSQKCFSLLESTETSLFSLESIVRNFWNFRGPFLLLVEFRNLSRSLVLPNNFWFWGLLFTSFVCWKLFQSIPVFLMLLQAKGFCIPKSMFDLL